MFFLKKKTMIRASFCTSQKLQDNKYKTIEQTTTQRRGEATPDQTKLTSIEGDKPSNNHGPPCHKNSNTKCCQEPPKSNEENP